MKVVEYDYNDRDRSQSEQVRPKNPTTHGLAKEVQFTDGWMSVIPIQKCH